MAPATSLSRLVPPRAAMVGSLSVTVTVPLAVGVALAGLLGGGLALLGVAIGVMTGVQAAITAVPRAARLAVLATTAVLGGLGIMAAPHALVAAALVALAGLLEAPWSIRSAGVGAMLPVAPAIAASLDLPDRPVEFAAWTLVGGLLVTGVARVLGVHTPPTPVRTAVAWRHAAVTAVAVGAAFLLVAERGLSHGYWLVLTLAVVLRPVRGETGAGARDRSLGTLAGFAVAVAAVLVLPRGVSLAAAVLCLLASIAWVLAGNVMMQYAYLVPVVVLTASSGVVGADLGLALERLLLTAGGAATAVVLAVLLAWWDRDSRAPGEGSDVGAASP